MTEKKKSYWGVGSFGAYGLFVVFVLAMVLYASIQKVDLAEQHPYEKGLAYQERIDRLNRTAILDSGVVLEPRPAAQTLVIHLPNLGTGTEVRGEVRLLRPSNERFDRRWELRPDSTGAQEISLAGLPRGLWRIEIDWTVDSQSYYYQSRVVIP